jgi:hypothetical protein
MVKWLSQFLNSRNKENTPPPRPPRPDVSAPDFGFQIRPCLDPTQAGQVESTLRQFVSQVQPSADIRSACLNGVHHFAVWTEDDNREPDAREAARRLGLRFLNLIGPGESFGRFHSSSFFLRFVKTFWDRIPKQFGSIHLGGYYTQMPGRPPGGSGADMLTWISGVLDVDLLPDAPFRVILGENLDVRNGNVVASSVSKVVEIDSSGFADLVNFFLPPLGSILPIDTITFNVSDISFAALASIQAQLHFKQVKFGGNIVSFNYSRIGFNLGSVYSGGTVVLG